MLCRNIIIVFILYFTYSESTNIPQIQTTGTTVHSSAVLPDVNATSTHKNVTLVSKNVTLVNKNETSVNKTETSLHSSVVPSHDNATSTHSNVTSGANGTSVIPVVTKSHDKPVPTSTSKPVSNQAFYAEGQLISATTESETGRQKIKGRKGVNYTEFLVATTTEKSHQTSTTPQTLPEHTKSNKPSPAPVPQSSAATKTTTLTPSPSPTTPKITVKTKPHFTMVVHDNETPSESFIESTTTGRDFVFPIVLTILLLPFAVYLIRIIYRRGTQYTERQQYHRMYLIDGMYNSR